MPVFGRILRASSAASGGLRSLLLPTFLVVLFAGCSKSEEAIVREAVCNIEPEEFFRKPLTWDGAFRWEPSIETVADKYGTVEVVRLLEEMYSEAQEPRARAQVVAALRPCLRSEQGRKEAVPNSVVRLIRRALLDKDDHVGYVALRLLRLLPQLGKEDLTLLRERMETAEDGQFLSAGYRTLMDNGFSDVILAQLARPGPENPDKRARVAWFWRRITCVDLCKREEWQGDRMPEGLGERLLAIVLEDDQPDLTRSVADVLVWLKAVRLVPAMKRAVELAPSCPDKLFLACGALQLEPKDADLRERIPALVEKVVASFSPGFQDQRYLEYSTSCLIGLAVATGDADFLVQCWRPYEALPSEVRGRLFERVFGAVIDEPRFAVALLGEASDGTVRGALALLHLVGSGEGTKAIFDSMRAKYQAVPGGTEAVERMRKLAREVGRQD